jgi:hypothetical protein
VINSFIGDPGRSALLVTSAGGALAVVLSYLIFCNLPLGKKDSLLFAMIFGFTSSFWLLSSIPETYSLNVLMIVTGFYLQTVPVVKGKGILFVVLGFIIYSVIATGITLSNFVYATFAFINFLRKQIKKFSHGFFILLFYFVSVTLLLVKFSFVQKWLYNSYCFCSWSSLIKVFQSNSLYFFWNQMRTPAGVSAILLTFFSYNIIAPKVSLIFFYDFLRPWNILGFVGTGGLLYWIANLFFLFLIIFSLTAGLRKKLFFDKDWQLALSFILFNLIFHFFYRAVGIPFIFAVHVTFSIIFLIASAYQNSGAGFKRIVLIIFLLLLFGNNFNFISSVNHHLRYDQPNFQSRR